MSAVEAFVQTEVQSPFLPGTQIQYAWDSTSLGYLKTCAQLYKYVMIDGWQPRGASIHLRFGIEFHQAVGDYESHIALGCDHDEALVATVRELLIRTMDFNPAEADFGKHARYKNRYMLMKSVIWYLDTYPSTKDSAKTHILENGKPAVELSFRFEMNFGPQAGFNNGGSIYDAAGGQMDYIEPHYSQPYILCGHLDRVVSYNDDLFVMDHKTTTTTPGDYFFDQFNPNNQMSLYTLAGKTMLQSPIRGVIINAIQIQLEAIVPKRGFTYRTENQIEEWIEDTKEWLARAEDYATRGVWPKNDTSCDKFGGCAFRDICAKDQRVRQNYLKSNFVQLPEDERWNPLRPR